MGLDEDAGLLLVGLAQGVAGLDGLVHQGFEIGGDGDARAVGHTPQKSGRPSVSVGWRQLTALASISDSVYLPAPRGPARMSEWGNRPARMLSRRWVTVCALPRK